MKTINFHLKILSVQYLTKDPVLEKCIENLSKEFFEKSWKIEAIITEFYAEKFDKQSLGRIYRGFSEEVRRSDKFGWWRSKTAINTAKNLILKKFHQSQKETPQKMKQQGVFFIQRKQSNW